MSVATCLLATLSCLFSFYLFTLAGAHGSLSLRVALAHLDQGWEIALRGDNLTDEDYATIADGDGGGNYWDMPGRPASWTVELRYDF